MGLRNAAAEVRTITVLLESAESIAKGRGDTMPGPEHLLMSALALDEGSAARALARCGVDASALDAAIDHVHAEALSSVGLKAGETATTGSSTAPAGIYRSTPQAQQVFQEAVALSKQSKPSRLLGAHIVAATCSLERGTVVRALALLGVDRHELRAAALAEAAGQG